MNTPVMRSPSAAIWMMATGTSCRRPINAAEVEHATVGVAVDSDQLAHPLQQKEASLLPGLSAVTVAEF